MIRAPAVAGQFYPGSESALRAEIERYMPPSEDKQHALGIVSPHAGYVYSGPVAGAVFSQIEPPETAVVLAPNHTGMGRPFALWERGQWETPLGIVEIDFDLAQVIRTETGVAVDDQLAHQNEHSAEVQVPFLQALNPRVRIVPMVISSHSVNDLQAFGQGIARAIQSTRPGALVVASTDMTHYEPHDTAEQKDRLAIDQILALDEAGLMNTVASNRISMCGVGPTAAAIACCKQLGATKATLVKYQTSGDTSGDYSRVVGYAGVILQ